MVGRTYAMDGASIAADMEIQRQGMIAHDAALMQLFEDVKTYGRTLDASRQILKMDRSAAKVRISEPFGRWVASLDFFLQMARGGSSIPKKYQDLYTEIYDVLRPRSHWHQLGGARDPWLAAPYDSTYGPGRHVFTIPANNWSAKNRLIQNSEEATPGFIAGYNEVYDKLMGNPAISSAMRGMKRLKPK